jgi:uncharacterized membrane protein
MIAIELIILLSIPFVLLHLDRRVSWANSIIMSYALGIVLGNTIPTFFRAEILDNAMNISILLAIPLFLFQTSLSDLKRSDRLLKAFIPAILATTIAVLIWSFMDDGVVPEKMAMIEAVYTGGTINLNAVAVSLKATPEEIVIMNGYDMMVSGVYLLGLLSFIPGLFRMILKYEATEKSQEVEKTEVETPKRLNQYFLSLVSAFSVVGAAIGLSFLVKSNIDEFVVILGVSLFGLLVSRFEKIRALRTNYQLADYFILLFSFTIGYHANIGAIMDSELSFLGVFFGVFLSIVFLHLLLSRLLGIHADEMIVASTAAIFGPPFIAMITERLSRRDLIAGGVLIAILGNVVGTYLGWIIFWMLE